MNDQDASASSENRLDRTESSPPPRGLSPGTSGSRSRDSGQSCELKAEAQRVEIVLRVEAAEVKTEDTVKEEGRGQTTDDGKELSPALSPDRRGSAEIEESKGKTEDGSPRPSSLEQKSTPHPSPYPNAD